MPPKPLVSVLMPVYNGGAFLADAIESILGQSFKDFELVVIDDGSTDNIQEVLQEFIQIGPCIKVLKQETNLGLTKSLNHGLAECKGEFVARHDVDDLSGRERLACQVGFLKDHHDYGLIGTAVTRIDGLGNEIAQPIVISGDKNIRAFMRGGNAFVHGSVMMRKSTVEAVGGYRDGFRYAQDYDLWLRISEITCINNLPERLYKWRSHSAGISDKKLFDQTRYAALACYFAKERREKGKDSYTILEQDFSGNIDYFLNNTNLRNEIDTLAGKIFFRFGKRELARQSFLHTHGAPSWSYRFLCKSEWLFQLARKTARIAISLKK